MERLNTGIPGLDEIMGGGLPENQLVLVTGTAGTGKTTFSTQYAYMGAKKYNQNAVYLSFEEPGESLKKNMKNFGWDLGQLEAEGKFSFIRYDPYNIEDVMNVLESSIRDVGARRVVIDSISALALYVRDKTELRRIIFNMSLILRKLKCTPILVSEMVYGDKGLSRYGVEEFVADSVLVLYYERLQSSFIRAMQVWKLRGSSHSEKLHPYTIDENGITVYPKQEAFVKG